MGKIKNVSGEPREVPALGGRLVVPDQVVEVPDDVVYQYTQQETVWAPGDEESLELHDVDHHAYLERAGLLEPEDAPEPPGGNASRDEWVAWVTDPAVALATHEDLEGKGRDEIRDTYKPADPDSDDSDVVDEPGEGDDEHDGSN